MQPKYFLIVGISVLAASFWCNAQFTRIQTANLAFNQKPPYALKTSNRWQLPPYLQPYKKLDLPQSTFLTQIKPQTQSVTISFFYNCQPNCQDLDLQLKTKQGPPMSILLSSQKLENLDWFYVEDSGMLLYQKYPKFTSLTDFFQNRKNACIIVEDNLIQLLHLQTLPNIHKLSQTENLNDCDYLLSTYFKPRMFWGWASFQRTLDLMNAYRDENSNLVWTVTYQGNNQPEILMTEPVVSY